VPAPEAPETGRLSMQNLTIDAGKLDRVSPRMRGMRGLSRSSPFSANDSSRR